MQKAIVPVERIRRITGYITGDVTQWNNAKLQELKDRVTHTKNYVNHIDNK